MQRRQLHDRTGDANRPELRERRRPAGAPYRDQDVLEQGGLLLGRELVRHGPPGRVRGRPEARVELPVLHFHDNPVDLVAEPVPPRLEVPAVGEHRLEVRHDLRLRVDGQARAAQQVQGARLRRKARHPVHLVEEGAERPAGGDGRVLLAKRSRGRVSWVGKGPEPGRGLAAVQLLERGHREVDLATYLGDLRDLTRRQGQDVRDGGNGAHIRRHVLADASVTAGGAAQQAAVLVGERDRQAVDLRFTHERRSVLGSQQPLQPGAPGEDLLESGDLVQAHHGRAVRDGREQRRRRDPDRLGR